MNRKIFVLIMAIIVIVLISFGFLMITSKSNNKNEINNSSSNKEENSNVSSNEEDNNSNNINSNNKVVVIFFSASGTTKNVAQVISREVNGDLIEIEPKKKYTSADLNWNDSKSRTSVECNDPKSRPEIANTINVDNYDVIYLGYPIWWGDVPHIILTFMDTYKLDGKTIIPFCTSGGTGISQSMNTLKGYNKNVKWIDGKRLSSVENEIKNWVNSLNY